MISLATSKVNDKVRENIKACLDENRLGQGRFIQEFEEKVAKYMDAKHAIAVCNGSMADIVALGAIKAKSPGKTEVIVPALTFIAHTNAILANGLTPIFVDVRNDYQIDIGKIEEKITENTLAVFPVHLLGKSCDMFSIMNLANQYNISVIEDCCEAFGGEILGKKFGTFGDFGTFSFFPSHTITTGEGGMIITNNDELAELARSIKNHGRVGDSILDKFHFNYVGFNGKMSNILAAIGSAMVDEAGEVIEKRKQNVEYLNEVLDKDWYADSPHCYPVVSKDRNAQLEKLEKNNIEARKLFSCLPTQEKAYRFLKYRVGEFPVSERIGETHYFLPIHQDLTKENLDYIISKV